MRRILLAVLLLPLLVACIEHYPDGKWRESGNGMAVWCLFNGEDGPGGTPRYDDCDWDHQRPATEVMK